MNVSVPLVPPTSEAIDASTQYGQLLQTFRNDRLNWVRKVLGATPEPGQAAALRALDNGEEKLSIRSGHGVGKSTLLAWCMLHYILHYYPCKIVITAPSAPQLYDAAFAEVKYWIAKLPAIYSQNLVATSDRVYMEGAQSEAFISARTSRAESPEALQGIHSKNTMIVVDEASGVPEPIFESAQGSMSTPHAITILTGNPTRRSGFFYNTHTKWADDWWTLKIACHDSSQVQDSFITGMAKRYGMDSAVYAVRVLGEFPPAESDTFIPYYLIEEAMAREIDPPADVPFTFGVDVARFGDDDTVLCKRQGYFVHPLKVWKKLDTMQVAARIMFEYQVLPEHLRPAEIYIDVIGIGAGVADRLRQLLADTPCDVVDINVSELPTLGSQYHRLRDDLWGSIREAAESRKLCLPKDDELLAELTTPKLEFTGQGKMQLESKDKMIKRGLKSPDRGDALALCFAYEGAVAAGLTVSNRQTNPNEAISNDWVL